jgi:hypothetical protein
MITVKASQKLFTYAEVTNLTGICADHLENRARRHWLGFIGRVSVTHGKQTDEWFSRPWNLMLLATPFPGCAH